MSHDPSRVFGKLIILTRFFLIDFFKIPSFNIVFEWELGFMIYFGLIFMRLSRLHDPRIVFNELTHIDLYHFFN
jgi:hypothetical protein